MARHLWETKHKQEIAAVAEQLRVPPDRLRPCFLIAWRLENRDPRHRMVMAETIGFLATELKLLGQDQDQIERRLIAWAKRNGGWPGDKLRYAAAWPFKHKVRNRCGCPSERRSKPSKTRHFCVGRDSCKWFKRSGWRDERRAADARFTARPSLLREGGWYEVFPPASVEDQVYTMLCEFEAWHGLTPGDTLYFSQGAAQESAHRIWGRRVRAGTVSAALDRLADAGLVTIVSRGKPGKGHPRKVARVVKDGQIPVAPAESVRRGKLGVIGGTTSCSRGTI